MMILIMTEEEANKFYDDNGLDQIIERKHFIEKLKNTGYIKKSNLEITKDKFKKLIIAMDGNLKQPEKIILDYTVELEKELAKEMKKNKCQN